LRHATDVDVRWLRRVLRKISSRFGSRVDLAPDATLRLCR
jgi:hypothetical protein